MADNQADNTNNDQKQAELEVRNAEIRSQWEGDFKEEDLVIPYSRDEAEKKEENEENTDTASDKTQEDDTKSQEVTEIYEDPTPVVTVKDPGEFNAGDLSFEVTLADGNTHKVNSIAEAEALAEDPDNFETPKQLTQFLTKVNRMQNAYDKAYEKWENQKQTYDNQVAEEADRQATVANYANEFQYLANKGFLPQIPAEYANADWQDPEVASNEVVKQYTAVLDYMVKENQERAEAKVTLLTSVVDAFNAMQADPANKRSVDEQVKAEVERRTQAQARKAAGARVAGTSPGSSTPYVPKGIAVGNPNIMKRGVAIWDD